MFEINRDNYSLFAYTNADQIKDFQGAVVNFHGLNKGLDMADASANLCSFCTEHNLLYVFPYLNPWNWMNSAAVSTTDHILDAIWDAFSLPRDFPLALVGRSMGGHGALIYALQGKYHPACCALNCPVCDMLYHYSEREDVPRTMYAAFFREDSSLEDELRKVDPISLVSQMHRIPYYIAHCEQDTQVNKKQHSDRFVQSMRQSGIQVEYRSVPGRGHIDLTPEIYNELFCFIKNVLTSR